MNLWDRPFPQIIITLNFFWCSSLNSKLYTYVQVYGMFDLDCTPLAPPGTKVMMHKKPDNRDTWDPPCC